MFGRKRYPRNWPTLAQQCKQEAAWLCEHCRIAHGTERVSKRTGQPYRVALGAAHLDHDPENPDPRLAALCPSCHGRYDWQYRQQQAGVDLERLKHRMQLKKRGRNA